MKSRRYGKKMPEPPPWTKYVLQDTEWLITEVEPVEVEKWNKITTYRLFMKTYIFEPEQLKYIKNEIKYIWVLNQCFVGQHCIDTFKFKTMLWFKNPMSFSHLKTRLVRKWILCKRADMYYMNPAITHYGEKPEQHVEEMFRDMNMKMFWITQL